MDEYVEDAYHLWREFGDLRAAWLLEDGTLGWKIDLSAASLGREAGIYSANGTPVSFWYGP